MQTAPVAKVADPRNTTALAVYLGALNFAVTPEALTQWLTLVGVLAREIGSDLAVVLAGSAQPASVTARREADSAAVA